MLSKYAAKAPAVNRAGAVGAQGGEVGARAVTDVSGEALVRKLRVVVAHQRVAESFRNHGGGGDGGRD